MILVRVYPLTWIWHQNYVWPSFQPVCDDFLCL